jgi:hypothetical protein
LGTSIYFFRGLKMMGDFAMVGNCGENPLDGFISNADKSAGFV